MARMLRLSGFPLWARDRTVMTALIVMAARRLFSIPSRSPNYGSVAVAREKILAPKLVDVFD